MILLCGFTPWGVKDLKDNWPLARLKTPIPDVALSALIFLHPHTQGSTLCY